MSKKVIIIEDDRDISNVLDIHLKDLDCDVRRFSDGTEGLEYCLKNAFDLLVLDINLPGTNGMEVCRVLRTERINHPILMLTARGEEMDKVAGLELGADDYMTKPFSIKEFIARVKVIFRRNDNEPQEKVEPVINYRHLMIDKAKRIVTLKGERLDLTPKEFDLLFLLASNPGVTYDRKKLLNLIWGYDFEGYEHTVNTHINRLRIKIESDVHNPEYVLTTWGVGYRFNDSES
ncbi:MAG: response regulator transcription factor [Flavobacteriales bacterium]